MNEIWIDFSPRGYGSAGGVLQLNTVSKELLEDLEMTIRRINMQKEDEMGESDGDSSGTVTPRALEQQHYSLSTSSSRLPTASLVGDYFSLSQEHHHRQGLYQTLTVYQRQDSFPKSNLFTLLPLMRGRFVDRPTCGDPSKQNPSPTTNMAESIRVTVETPPQFQDQEPCLETIPTSADTATLAPQNQQGPYETMPPPPCPAALSFTNSTRGSSNVRGKRFSSLSSMLSTEPTAPGSSAASQTPGENITRYLGISVPVDPDPIGDYEAKVFPYPAIPPTPILHAIGICTAQPPDTQIQDHDHPQPAQAPGAGYPQRTDLVSIRQARLLGSLQYWVWRAGEEWEQEMERVRVEMVRFEADRREWIERMRLRRTGTGAKM